MRYGSLRGRRVEHRCDDIGDRFEGVVLDVAWSRTRGSFQALVETDDGAFHQVGVTLLRATERPVEPGSREAEALEALGRLVGEVHAFIRTIDSGEPAETAGLEGAAKAGRGLLRRIKLAKKAN